MAEGNKVLKDLQSQVDWDTIVEDHKENMEVREREIELFGEVLNEDDMLAELEALEAEEAAAEMAGPVGTGAISASDAAAYRQEHGIEANLPEAAPEEAPPQRQAQLA